MRASTPRCNLFTSLGYLGDEADTKVLGEIRRVLKPGGKLVLETMHRDRLVEGWQDKDWMLMGEGRLLLAQRTFDPVTGVAQTTQTLIDGRGERDVRTFSVRTYTATELLKMIEPPASPTPSPTARSRATSHDHEHAW